MDQIKRHAKDLEEEMVVSDRMRQKAEVRVDTEVSSSNLCALFLFSSLFSLLLLLVEEG